jgi:predicted RecA/RadA family phage recombinase
MATNEVFKDSDWIPLPVTANLKTVSGDPVKVGGLVGVAQAVGGQGSTYTIGSLTVTDTSQNATSLEDGYMSVALRGAFAFPVTGASDSTPMGTAVYFAAGNATTSSTLTTTSAANMGFGHIVNRTTDGRFVVRLAGRAF